MTIGLGVYLLVLSALAARTGVTIDEPSHILSSILYWEGNDRLPPRDMPPLIKIVGGWAAAEAGFRIPEESAPVWQKYHEWDISMDMMRRMSERTIRTAMFRARLPLLIFPALTALLLWWWGRQLFTPLVGVLCAGLWMMEPTSLGHAPLFKNDHASAFGYLLFAYTAWRFWRAPSWGTLTMMSAACGVAILTKLSMLILLPVAPAIAILRLRKHAWGKVAGAAVLTMLIPYCIAFAACQFEITRREHMLIDYPWMPIPAPYWVGVQALLWNTGKENAVYLLGQREPWGSPAYFVIASAVKTPEVLLLLIVAGIGVQLTRAARRQTAFVDLFWLLPGLAYLTLASRSPLQLGFRLVMPCLPFAILLCGPVLNWLLQGRRRALVPVLYAALFAPLTIYYPLYLSYFNRVSGGPENGLRYLADSNLDWGQDLRELRNYVNRNQLPRIHLAYFGSDNPFAYFGHGRVNWIEPPFTDVGKRIRTFQPSPGIYAISANLLGGQFFEPAYRDYFHAFRKMRPMGYAGYSIYIYRVR
ncbi:MAG: glycosyltransferase family 39 protein [Acidobacteria bacterium]|nr:glycosyltransferase family 39 protein [Acidobacteriota bacterium]